MTAPADQREAEGLRYRYQVMLNQVVTAARRAGSKTVEREALALLSEVKQIDDHAQLKTREARIVAVGAKVGVDFTRRGALPKWLRLALWTLPVVAVVGLLVMILERRRRLRTLDEATVEKWQEQEAQLG